MNILNLTEVLEWEEQQSPKIIPTLRNAFDCGELTLNNFLSKNARQASEENIARTWVLLDKANKKIAGYISISNASIEKDSATGTKLKVHVNPIPALLIGRLAVATSYGKKGLGEELLLFGFKKARELNEISAIQAIVVDALNANAEAFYGRYGFEKIGEAKKMLISTKELFE